jgi:hypothetical protein
MKYPYLKNTPQLMIIAMALVAIFSVIPLANLIVLGLKNLTVRASEKSLAELGQFGDFFGGHTSAFTGSISLIVIIFFTFHQSKQQEMFFEKQAADNKNISDRQFFLDGINLITQWDLSSPGCDQCMRLLDYYGRLALASTDRELLLMLNTVITAEVRKNLEGKNGSFKSTNYPFACEAIDRIKVLREEDGRGQKTFRKNKVEQVL